MQKTSHAWFKYFSTLLEGLKDYQLRAAPFYFFHLLRRIIFVVVAMYLFERPWFQVFIYMLQSLAMAWYLITNKPFISPSQNYSEIFNELVVLVIAYHMTLIMSPNIDWHQREMIGISLIAFTSSMIVVNAIIWA